MTSSPFAPLINRLLHLIIWCGLGVLTGCNEEVNPPDIATYYIHPELAVYLDRFMEEAAVRNITIDTTGINLDLVDEPLTDQAGAAACGLAHVYGRSFPNVRISRLCWDLFSPEHRETLLFHELGHALLDRPHFDAALPVGSPLSMMNANSSRVYNAFTLFKRDYYLDELFGLSPEVPFWGKAKSQTDTLFYYPVAEGAQPWSAITDFVTGGGATTSVVTDTTFNQAFKITIPEQAKGSSLRLAITLDPSSHPRAGASVYFSADVRVEDFRGTMPRLLLTASRAASIQPVHSGSSNPDSFNNTTTIGYTTLTFMPIDYFVDADFITAEIQLSDNSVGTIWLDNITIIARY